MSSQERYRREDNVLQYTNPPSAPEREVLEPTRGARLHIAMLAPPWIPVPPPGYGGIEFVVALVTNALVDHGHDVELFCAPGSSSRAKVRPLLDQPHPESIERALFEGDHDGRAFRAIDEAARDGHPFDVIHDNSGYVALAMADRVATSVVHTVHGPFDDDTKPYYAANGHNGAVVCISEAQSRMAPDPDIVDAVVHNPIDVDNWPVGYEKQDYLLWLGRMAPEKGAHRAIRVAKATGRRLVLAGVVQPGQERFFAKEVQPHIDGETIRFIGEVGGARKQRLFADAFAFLMPIRWPEPFGMVMVEAMAAGTPVLAFPEGAAPEIVEDGVSGYLVADEEEMAARVDDAGRLDPLQVRRSAERFAPDRIAVGYEQAYRAAARQVTGARS
ncbi:MAG: glycosyltransferase family 4 protein [Solirubrobacterales bacterium]|nr:glycosyltransferase family 4 protein [Solirubrobacterales bacterium]